jgi:hypothetical protein
VDRFINSLSTTQLRFQRSINVEDTYVLGTIPERLYKRIGKAIDADESDGTFVLTPNVQAPTLDEIAAVQAEVEDDALTKAIELVKSTMRSSGRRRVDSTKVKANKAAQLEKAAE